MQSQRDYVLRTVEERGIRFVQLWFTDVLGIPKTFAITPADLEVALDEGMIFDGSAIDGFSRVQESDVLARPDPTTFQLLPFTAGRATVARVVCDIVNIDGTPFEGDPRHVLRRQLERARQAGYSCFAAPELEYSSHSRRLFRRNHSNTCSPSVERTSDEPSITSSASARLWGSGRMPALVSSSGRIEYRFWAASGGSS